MTSLSSCNAHIRYDRMKHLPLNPFCMSSKENFYLNRYFTLVKTSVKGKFLRKVPERLCTREQSPREEVKIKGTVGPKWRHETRLNWRRSSMSSRVLGEAPCVVSVHVYLQPGAVAVIHKASTKTKLG